MDKILMAAKACLGGLAGISSPVTDHPETSEGVTPMDPKAYWTPARRLLRSAAEITLVPAVIVGFV
jgi:hypothetical protein